MSDTSPTDPLPELARLCAAAWAVREHAHILGKTRVGCALLGVDEQIYAGCNVEHVFRSHDVHAEVNAIGSMVAGGCTQLIALVVVADRTRFTPCGACMDWIMQFGGPDCTIAFQSFEERERGTMLSYSARQLMPHYPI